MTDSMLSGMALAALLLSSLSPLSSWGQNEEACTHEAHGGNAQASVQADASARTPGERAPTRAGDRIEVVMEGDTSVVNVYRERGIGGAEVRMPKSGWPAAVVVRLHGFPDLESFKAEAGASSLTCELERPEGRAPEQVCRMGDTRLEALSQTPKFYQIMLPKSMLTPEIQRAELRWVDQWR